MEASHVQPQIEHLPLVLLLELLHHRLHELLRELVGRDVQLATEVEYARAPVNASSGVSSVSRQMMWSCLVLKLSRIRI